jgi:hypothetical protein
MPAEQSTPYKQEVNTCLKRLENLQHENIQLKNKIAEIIRNDVSKEVLDRIEVYLTNLLNKDAVIALLRYDIAEEIKRSGTGCDKLKSNYNQDISKMENEIKNLKIDFHQYISQAIAL